jgi:hypothetical protein
MTLDRLLTTILIAFAATSLARGAAPPASPDRAHQAVLAAMAAAGDIPAQAKSLTALAWPAGKRDEAIAASARHELEGFGDHAVEALRDSLNTVKASYTAEVVTTTLGALRNSRVELAGDGLASLIDALWVGSREAKTLAITALGSSSSPYAVQPMIDSALDDPALAPLVVATLGRMRYATSRFYLERVMMEGPAELRPVAASSLSQIGGAALGPLRNALKAPERDTRLLAARALLPSATEYDLGAIYEYLDQHGNDDAATTLALKSSAANIEKAIAARDANAAAASPKDF